MQNIGVRLATIDDIGPLADLLYILFSEEVDFEPNRENQTAGLKLIIENPDRGFILCAVINEKIVGMVSILRVISTAEGGEAGILEDMVITPGYRGKGLGSALLNAAILHAKSSHLKRLTLLTDLSNHKAINFYKKSGFVQSAMTPLRVYLD